MFYCLWYFTSPKCINIWYFTLEQSCYNHPHNLISPNIGILYFLYLYFIGVPHDGNQADSTIMLFPPFLPVDDLGTPFLWPVLRTVHPSYKTKVLFENSWTSSWTLTLPILEIPTLNWSLLQRYDLAIYLVWVSRWGKSGKATWGKKLLSRNLPKKYFNKLLKFFNKLLKFLNKLLKYLNKLLKYLISWKPICWLGLPSILGSRVLEFLGNVKIFSHLENSNWTTLRLLSRLLLMINYKHLIHLRGCWGAGCCCWYRWVLFCNPASFSFSSFTLSFKL